MRIRLASPVVVALLSSACSRGVPEPPVVRELPDAAATAPGGAGARAIPIGDGPRTRLPPPSVSCREDLPPEAACRIGSARFALRHTNEEPVLGTDGRLYLEAWGIWRAVDASTGVELERFELQAHAVTPAISPAGTCVVSWVKGDDGNALTMFRMPERKAVGTSAPKQDHDQDAFVADDCSVLVRERGYRESCLAVFGPGRASPPEDVARLSEHPDLCLGAAIDRVALSGDGRRLVLASNATGAPEGGVHVFDVATRERIGRFAGKGSEDFGEVAIARDGARVAYEVDDVVLVTTIGPAPSGTETTTFARPPNSDVVALTFSPDAAKLAFVLAGMDGGHGLAMVDLARRTTSFVLTGLPPLSRVAFSPDGARAAIAMGDGVRIVDTTTGGDVVGHGRLFAITSAALAASAERAVISAAAHLSVWDARDCTLLAKVPNEPPLTGMTLTSDAQRAFGRTSQVDASGEMQRRYVRVDLGGAGARTEVALGPGVGDVSSRGALSPDGRWLALGVESGEVRAVQEVLFIDTGSNTVSRRVSLGRIGPVDALLFTADGASVHAVAPPEYAPGESPSGDTSVVEIDVASGVVRSRFTIPGVAESDEGVVLERGRIIEIEHRRFVRATGEPLPRGDSRWRFMGSSGDHARALWGDGARAFVWPVDEPLPSPPPPRQTFALGAGPAPVVGQKAVMRCDDVSCVVWRTP